MTKEVKDKLKAMFLKQEKLQNEMGYSPYAQDVTYIRWMFTGCVTELCEILETVPWKPWKHTHVKRVKENFIITDETREEVVDLWHFVINLTMACGMNSDELFEMFNKKNEINVGRQVDGY